MRRIGKKFTINKSCELDMELMEVSHELMFFRFVIKNPYIFCAYVLAYEFIGLLFLFASR